MTDKPNADSAGNITMDIDTIKSFLPHRYPFLLVDRVVQCTAGQSITVIKNVTVNEPHFDGHFPGNPLMPGVLIIEAMAQASGLLAYTAAKEADRDALYFLVGVDKARFRRPVRPGDQLSITAVVLREKRGIWKFACEATVEGKVVVSAEIMCAPGGRK